MKDKLVGFVHIEKAAGITLHNMLHRDYFGYISPSPEYDEFILPDKLKKIIKYYPSKIHGFGGHRIGSFMNYEKMLDSKIFYFTFVRNPIDRYISHLNWQKFIMKKEWNVEEFINESYFSNFQCYRFGGKRTFEDVKSSIDKFDFIGVFEKFDKSILMLSEQLKGFNPEYSISNEKKYDSGKIVF